LRRIGSFKWCEDEEDDRPMMPKKKMYEDGHMSGSMSQEMDMEMDMEMEMEEMQQMPGHKMHHMHGMHHMHEGMQLAHSYVPWQCYEQAFCPREALMKGTLFPELFGVYPIPE
jgi:hypothetical protein